MALPIVIAYHLVWTGYGWWLPNDPRGSVSHSIRCDVIADLGMLHHGRKRVQPASHEIRGFLEKSETALQFPRLKFDAPDVEQIALAFSQTLEEQRYTCYACAIMPDHVHVLIRKHKHQAEEMIQNLQKESHLKLRESDRINWEHPVWGGPGWKVFLDSPEEIRRTIKYIEENPVKIGLPRQGWEFVKMYDGWPLHEGHSPNSPYARRMRRKHDT
jgi:REP element-mobilizing transposase RayT